MKRRFVRKPGVRFVSADGEGYTTWCFDRVIEDETYLSFQVARAEFDQMLLENARGLGATVHEATPVTAVEMDGHGAGPVTVHGRSESGEDLACTARFLIDASGRDTFLGSKMRWRRPHEGLDRTALWSHWAGVQMQGGLEDGVSIIAYLGGDKKGWAWVFPLARDLVTVGFVTENSYLRDRKAQLQGDHPEWQQELYVQEILQSPFIARVLDGARQTKPLFLNADYSYSVDHKHGPNYALVGDAGRFIDPIFSSGVFLSIKSARLVTRALLDGRADDGSLRPDLAPAYQTIDGAYNFVHRMIRLFYNPHSLSWAEAAPTGVDEGDEAAQRHSAAMAAGHYMLAGDFFENQEKYHEMFDVLEKPRSFRQYKKLVIDRKRFQEVSCRRDEALENFPRDARNGA